MLELLLVDAAGLGYHAVGISGGEPLLYRPLVSLLGTAKRAGLRTSLTTNGLLLTPRRLDELVGVLDGLALSLDGRPETHVAMRRDARAFKVLDSRLAGVRKSGIPFGFASTLTMTNLAEFEFIVRYAAENGAAFVQIHPLEPEGAALRNLMGQVPDIREQAFAIFEAFRLAQLHGVPVQVNITRRRDLVRRPEDFSAGPGDRAAPLGDWLSPLVIETDGRVVPLAYGFPDAYALGSLADAPLSVLAADWDREDLLSLCRATVDRLATGDRQFFNWYEELTHSARAPALTPGE
jgi:MoaA/NifB/PqqE/SkfB family radical SAM enzyme